MAAAGLLRVAAHSCRPKSGAAALLRAAAHSCRRYGGVAALLRAAAQSCRFLAMLRSEQAAAWRFFFTYEMCGCEMRGVERIGCRIRAAAG
jgi:hypothetical protein